MGSAGEAATAPGAAVVAFPRPGACYACKLLNSDRQQSRVLIGAETSGCNFELNRRRFGISGSFDRFLKPRRIISIRAEPCAIPEPKPHGAAHGTARSQPQLVDDAERRAQAVAAPLQPLRQLVPARAAGHALMSTAHARALPLRAPAHACSGAYSDPPHLRFCCGSPALSCARCRQSSSRCCHDAARHAQAAGGCATSNRARFTPSAHCWPAGQCQHSSLLPCPTAQQQPAHTHLPLARCRPRAPAAGAHRQTRQPARH